MALNVTLGVIGLGLAIANFACNVLLRRTVMHAFFALAWAMFFYWLVFLAPHLRNDIFGGLFSLLVSAW